MVRVLIILLMSIFIGSNICFADESNLIAEGIEAYKNGNYEQCISNMKAIVKDDPTCAIGYYYLGLSYSKTGKNILAVRNYDKVITLGSDKTLINLAKRGKNNLSNKTITAIEAQIEDIEGEIKENTGVEKVDKLSPAELKAKYEDKIAKQKENASNAKTVKASDYSNQGGQPSNDEIVNAIRVLQRAGLLPNGAAGLMQNMPNANGYGYNPQMDSKTQQMNAMLMMMGQNGNNNNNSMMNMLPYMNNGGQVNPQMIQMMMMNQMMPNFSTGNNNGY